ncbi:tRNA dihydrouridine synthase DusB [Patescibacteria group bacterium]
MIDMSSINWTTYPKPIIALSPMADLTDSAYCRVVKSMASPIVFREMVSSEAIVRGNDKTLGMVEINPDERPLVQQIFGSNPKVMAEAARIIENSHCPEAFDINMGCPAYKLVHSFNGSALMKDPKLASQIVKETKAAISVPLSVKIRLGWSEPDECLEFVKVLEDAGADLISIHGRTKTQGYAGAADWDMIGQAKKQVKIPVLANGDIRTANDFDRALEITGCDGALIARGALGNPWIFKHIEDKHKGLQISDITMTERIRIVKQHTELHLELYGERGIVTFRKHLSWYFKGIPGAKRFRERLHTVTSKNQLFSTLDEMLVNQS